MIQKQEGLFDIFNENLALLNDSFDQLNSLIQCAYSDIIIIAPRSS